MTSPTILLALLCVTGDDANVAQFTSHIRPAFHELVQARSATVPKGLNALRAQVAEFDIKHRREASLVAFREAVGNHWPYDDASRTEEIRAYQNAIEQIPKLVSQAESGHTPLLSKAQAIERLKKISEDYPHTEADHRARRFLIRVYGSMEPKNSDEALRVHESVIADNKFLSLVQIIARYNEAQVNDRRSGNHKAKRELIQQLEKWEDISTVPDRLLTPRLPESHEDFIRRIVATVEGANDIRTRWKARLD